MKFKIGDKIIRKKYIRWTGTIMAVNSEMDECVVKWDDTKAREHCLSAIEREYDLLKNPNDIMKTIL